MRLAIIILSLTFLAFTQGSLAQIVANSDDKEITVLSPITQDSMSIETESSGFVQCRVINGEAELRAKFSDGFNRRCKATCDVLLRRVNIGGLYKGTMFCDTAIGGDTTQWQQMCIKGKSGFVVIGIDLISASCKKID